MTSHQRVRYRRLCIGLVAGVSATYPFVLPVPLPVLRGALTANSGWLLTNYLDSAEGITGQLRNAGRKAFVTVAISDLAATFRGSHPLTAEDDVQRLLAVLLPLKEVFLNAHELPHHPSDWPVLLSGVGYCDQINGAAATVLAPLFRVSQTYNVWDSERHGHTIGRVWSEEYGDWLYYDLFYDEVVVFRERTAGPIDLLARVRPERFPVARDGMRGAAYLHFLGHVQNGAPMNRYYGTTGVYIYEKVLTALRERTLHSIEPSRATDAVSIGLFPATDRDDPSSDSSGMPHLARAAETREVYLRARLEHLAGNRRAAAVLYARAARLGIHSGDPDVRLLARAAELFATRLHGPTAAAVAFAATL